MVGLRLGVANGSRRAHQALPTWQRTRAQGLGSEPRRGRRSAFDLGNGVILAGVARTRVRLEAAVACRCERTCPCVWADGLILRTPVYSDRDEARAAADRLAESGGRW